MSSAQDGYPFPSPKTSDHRLLRTEDQTDPDEALSDDDEDLSPLDDTLEKIGMGRYQKSLLILCGFGWMSDNMWLQCVAVILPRVQEHYDVSDRWIGLLSASIFAGMMLGAWGWGSYSDWKGRIPAFNLTLVITSLFGLLSAFAPSFPLLCLALFGLGTGVGGSMPTDGTLFLENIPKTHHYLLTALSAFFSLGAILTSLLGLIIIPTNSCPEPPLICDVAVENNGWRYMLGSLAAVSVGMSVIRLLFFRLHESAKFLVSAGRNSEAVLVLQKISTANGDFVEWELADVLDSRINLPPSTPGTPPARSSVDYGTPSPGSLPRSMSRTRIKIVKKREWIERLPEKLGVRDNVESYMDRLDGLFEPEWALTTKLIFVIWGFVSAGYTIFNVFLPKYLEQKVGEGSSGGGRVESLRDYVLYTVSGSPGSFLGAYLIETSWGRKGTMVISTIATSLATFVFVLVSSQTGVVLSSMVCSLAATLNAVIYSYTPEVFSPSIRGTATGIASALSRLAGIIAPLLTGVMLSIHVSLPLFVSAGCFAIAATAMLHLPIETRGKSKRTVMVH